MDSPAKQQETLQESTETSVADVYDDLDAKDEINAETIEEVEEVETTGEEETVAEIVDDEHQELTDADDTTEEIVEEVTEEYNEPPPERWPDEMREVYNNLPPEARQQMMDGIYKPMQRQYGQTTQELAEMRKGLEPMLESMNQYRGDFERMGVNPAEAFRRQMAWASHLSRVGPEQGMKDMAASYGLNQGDSGQAEEQYLTPVERAMQTKIDTLSEQIQGQQNFQQEQSQSQIQASQKALESQVQTGLQQFTNEQRDGKPAHPHIDKVAPAIAGLIRGGLVTQADEYGQAVPIRDQFAQAYKMACDLDPSIRSATPGNARQVALATAAQNVGVVTNTPVTAESGEVHSLSEGLESLYDKLDRTG